MFGGCVQRPPGAGGAEVGKGCSLRRRMLQQSAHVAEFTCHRIWPFAPAACYDLAPARLILDPFYLRRMLSCSDPHLGASVCVGARRFVCNSFYSPVP